MRSPALLVAPVAAVVLVAGCALTPGLDRRDDVGSLLAAWSEADDDAVGDVDRQRPRLVEDDAALAALRADLPRSLDRSALDVDLTSRVLVVGAWTRCQETARVVVADDRTTLTFQVVDPEDDVACDWSPVQLEVWEVDRSDLGAGDLRLTGYGHGRHAGGGRVTCPEPDRC